MSTGIIVGIRNSVLGCLLYPIVVWILGAFFGALSTFSIGAVGVAVMTAMILETGARAFKAGSQTAK